MISENKTKRGSLLIPLFAVVITGVAGAFMISVFRANSAGAKSQIGAAMEPSITATAAVEVIATAESTPTSTPKPDHSALCPLPDASTLLYISEENGYCFLYPADFQSRPEFYISERDVTLF